MICMHRTLVREIQKEASGERDTLFMDRELSVEMSVSLLIMVWIQSTQSNSQQFILWISKM